MGVSILETLFHEAGTVVRQPNQLTGANVIHLAMLWHKAAVDFSCFWETVLPGVSQ